MIQYINPNSWESGIYKIISPTGHYYIGSTINFSRRCFSQHFSRLKNNRHSNPHMQHRFNAYPTGWIFEAIQQVTPDNKELEKAELLYLNEHFGKDLCMNASAIPGRPGGRKGQFCTLETKKKMSEAHKGRPKTVEHRQKLSIALKGKPTGRKGEKLLPIIKARRALKILSKIDKQIIIAIINDSNECPNIRDITALYYNSLSGAKV